MKYYILDTETTGLDNEIQELTELAIVRCEDLMQKVWHIRIKHPERASPEALRITGKTIRYLLNNGKYVEEIADDVENFLNEDGETPESRVMIAHNSPFDCRFCTTAWANAGKIFPANYWLDTKEMGRRYVRRFLPNLVKPSLSLENLLKLTKVDKEDGAHGAGVDSRNTYMLWDHFVKNGIPNTDFIKKSIYLVKQARVVEQERAATQNITNEETAEEFYSFAAEEQD